MPRDANPSELNESAALAGSTKVLSGTPVGSTIAAVPRFGTVIRAARRRADLSQQALADRAGLKRAGTVGEIERGLYLPRLETARALARGLGIPFAVLARELEIAASEDSVHAGRDSHLDEGTVVIGSPAEPREEGQDSPAPGVEENAVEDDLRRQLTTAVAGIPPELVADALRAVLGLWHTYAARPRSRLAAGRAEPGAGDDG